MTKFLSNETDGQVVTRLCNRYIARTLNELEAANCQKIIIKYVKDSLHFLKKDLLAHFAPVDEFGDVNGNR